MDTRLNADQNAKSVRYAYLTRSVCIDFRSRYALEQAQSVISPQAHGGAALMQVAFV